MESNPSFGFLGWLEKLPERVKYHLELMIIFFLQFSARLAELLSNFKAFRESRQTTIACLGNNGDVFQTYSADAGIIKAGFDGDDISRPKHAFSW